jgi:hypothetical protein
MDQSVQGAAPFLGIEGFYQSKANCINVTITFVRISDLVMPANCPFQYSCCREDNDPFHYKIHENQNRLSSAS